MMVKISSSVHVKLEQGLNLRKDILETALTATELLQTFKQYKKETTQKTLLITKFKKEISELKGTLHEFELKDLPKDVTRQLQPKQMIIKTPRQLREEIEQEFKEPIVKSKIESELESLRAKIENIKI